MAQIEAMSRDTSSPHEAAIAAERLRKMKAQHPNVNPEQQQPTVKPKQPGQPFFDWAEYYRNR